jgi:integrase
MERYGAKMSTKATSKRRARRSFGAIKALRSGRFMASYVGPDGLRHNAPATFDTRSDADTWLAQRQTDIARDEWHKPAIARTAVEQFSSYADAWLTTRELEPRTREEYRKLLTGHLKPEFGELRLTEITSANVRTWYARLTETTGDTRRAHAYALLRTILNTAVADELIAANPCRIRGAGQTKRKRKIVPATLAELDVIVGEMREEYRLAILLAAWVGLRFGELAELRRGDVNVTRSTVTIERAVGVADGEFVVGDPKSEAGKRTLAIPPHLMPTVKAHLSQHTRIGKEALLFPAPTGSWLRSDGALHRDYHAARIKAGRPDLRLHDLRHTGATLAAATGATVKELMHRIGHSTPAMAMRYQHATEDRDKAIASALSEFHTAGVVQLRPRSAQSS